MIGVRFDGGEEGVSGCQEEEMEWQLHCFSCCFR